jgi:hypothetical protein
VLIFTSFRLESCPWLDAILRWILQSRIQFYSNLGKSATETMAKVRQAFGEESMSGARKVQIQTGEEQSQEHAHHFPQTTVTFLRRLCENVLRFELNFDDNRTCCSITTTHSFTFIFNTEFWTKNNLTTVPRLPYLPDLVPD